MSEVCKSAVAEGAREVSCSGSVGWSCGGGGILRLISLPFLSAWHSLAGAVSRHPRMTKGLLLLAVVVKVRSYRKLRSSRKEWNKAGMDVAILHTIPGGRLCPNLSPFVLKLETYFRAANIKYLIDCEYPMNSKHKTPWITINGEDMDDSQLIMERLGGRFNKVLGSDLSTEDSAIARSFLIMTDEHLYWGLLWWRYVADREMRFFELSDYMPAIFKIFKGLIKKMINKHLWSQGLGRHNSLDIQNIMYKDLKALSDFLGTKKYMMGSHITEVDCSMFGMMSQFVWNTPGSPFNHWINGEFKNLKEYVLRIKGELWPDWNKCLVPAIE